MKERIAATFGSFEDLSDFYEKEDSGRVALERASARKKASRSSGCASDRIAEIVESDGNGFYDKYRAKLKRAETRKVVELLDETKLAKAQRRGPDDSYLSLFLPGSPKRTRISKMMAAFDDFAAGRRPARRKGARR